MFKIVNEQAFQRSESKFINKTLFHMGIGLLITFAVAYLVSNSITIFSLVFRNAYSWIGFMLVELLLVRYLTRNITKLSLTTARVGFYVYSAINGLTLSSIFIVYQLGSISQVFIVAAAMFLCCSMIGVTTKIDLAPFGRILFMGLIGLMGCIILGMFYSSTQFQLGITVLGIVLFCALTAYDMQKIKKFHYQAFSVDGEFVNKIAIVSALELYLDFINLFIYLLRLFGRRR